MCAMAAQRTETPCIHPPQCDLPARTGGSQPGKAACTQNGRTWMRLCRKQGGNEADVRPVAPRAPRIARIMHRHRQNFPRTGYRLSVTDAAPGMATAGTVQWASTRDQHAVTARLGNAQDRPNRRMACQRIGSDDDAAAWRHRGDDACDSARIPQSRIGHQPAFGIARATSSGLVSQHGSFYSPAA